MLSVCMFFLGLTKFHITQHFQMCVAMIGILVFFCWWVLNLGQTRIQWIVGSTDGCIICGFLLGGGN